MLGVIEHLGHFLSTQDAGCDCCAQLHWERGNGSQLGCLILIEKLTETHSIQPGEPDEENQQESSRNPAKPRSLMARTMGKVMQSVLCVVTEMDLISTCSHHDTGIFGNFCSCCYCCCSVAKLCLVLCDPLDCSTPGLSVVLSPGVCPSSCPLNW